MELGRSMMSAGAGAARATGSSTTDWKICSINSGDVVLSLPIFRLVRSRSLSLGAWVPKNLARRRKPSAARCLLDLLGPPGRRSGCWPHDGEVAGGAVADSHFSDFRFGAVAAPLSGTGSASPRPDRNSWLRPRV